jgi:hypothetical protein
LVGLTAATTGGGSTVDGRLTVGRRWTAINITVDVKNNDGSYRDLYYYAFYLEINKKFDVWQLIKRLIFIERYTFPAIKA